MGTSEAAVRGPGSTSAPATLGLNLRFGWAIGSLGVGTLFNGVGFMLLFYLTTILGIEPALAGTLIFGSKLYDMVTDPVMGWASDRTRSRYGRRRPYLLAGGVLCAAAMAMLFTDSGLTDGSQLAYVMAGLLLYATGYTVFNVPYMAMPAEMTLNPFERSRLMSLRVIFLMLGQLCGSALVPALLSAFGSGAEAYAKTSWILAIIILVSMSLAFFGTRDAYQTRRDINAPPLREQVKSALGNRPFFLLICSKFAQLFGFASAAGSSLFLIKMVLLRPESDLAGFSLAATFSTIAAMPLWLKVSKTIGKRNTYFLGAALLVLAKLSWLVATTDEPQVIFLGRGLLFGFAAGGVLLIAQSMLPDTIQHDFDRTGLRREGLFAAMYSFAEKTAFALGPLAFGIILSVMG
ncbi:MAG: MFS transporter, partial [Gammaproteobacteria bacterium]